MALASLPTAALAAELRRRQSELPKLEKLAAKLRSELAEVLARIESLSEASPVVIASQPAPASVPATPKSSPRRTLKGQPTIGEQVVEILAARAGAMSPKEIADTLGARLSREVSSNFLVQISLTLARLVKQGRVNKIGRGQYAAAGASSAPND